jgi:hypothetical protein
MISPAPALGCRTAREGSKLSSTKIASQFLPPLDEVHPMPTLARSLPRIACLTSLLLLTAASLAIGQATPAETAPSAANAPSPAAREASFAKLLSGATLEGSYTSTGAEADGAKLSRDKYTLGEVKKLDGKLWSIQTRIQYGEHDVTVPITVPVEWAGDTPVIVVDKLALPGLGTFSARVMFFAKHYAGYWEHGDHGGHLFGIVHPADAPDAKPASPK